MNAVEFMFSSVSFIFIIGGIDTGSIVLEIDPDISVEEKRK